MATGADVDAFGSRDGRELPRLVWSGVWSSSTIVSEQTIERGRRSLRRKDFTTPTESRRRSGGVPVVPTSSTAGHSVDMRSILDQVSNQSTLGIAVIGGVHLFAFLVLGIWYRARLSAIAGLLDEFTRKLRHRSILDRRTSLGDQIEAFIADIREVLENPHRAVDRPALMTRIEILDERRNYLRSLGFDTCYNVARAMIEAYPLLGILGTILAIGLAVDTPGTTSVAVIVSRFGQAIWSTCAGLVAGLVLLFVNSVYEPAFIRISEQQKQIRDLISRAKGLLMAEPPVIAATTNEVREAE